MAADESYRGSFFDNYYTSSKERNPAVLGSRPSSTTQRPYSPIANSPYYSSNQVVAHHSAEQGGDQRYYQNSRNSHQSRDWNEIPLKPLNKIRTSVTEERQPADIEDPPSPVSKKSLSNSKYIPISDGSHERLIQKKSASFARIPWVVYVLTLAQISVFIVEIIKNSIVTGSPIMIHPQFNPHDWTFNLHAYQHGRPIHPMYAYDSRCPRCLYPIDWPCPNTTTSDPNAASNHCDLNVLCGFSGVNDADPNQWFRFIVPIFLHAGFIHILFNMVMQLTTGREVELVIGSVRFALVYFSSGIFGNVLGGNFAATAIASVGASGSLFGILAITLLDLIYRWNERPKPMRDLMFLLLEVLISFVLGLLPGLDNFVHIGGFLMGLTMGICILHSPNVLRQRTGDDTISQSDSENEGKRQTAVVTAPPMSDMPKMSIGFFRGRKPLWWAWWLIRAGALFGVLACFVVLINNFYKYRNTCSWCKYLSCLPINNWCSIGNLQLTNTTTTSTNNNRRDVLLRSGPALISTWADMF